MTKKAAPIAPIACGNCKKVFQPRCRTDRYCCRDCRYAKRKEDRARVANKSWKKERQCRYCGGPFMPKTPSHFYCKDSCRYRKDQGIPHVKACVHCGGPLPPGSRSHRIYCSDACAAQVKVTIKFEGDRGRILSRNLSALLQEKLKPEWWPDFIAGYLKQPDWSRLTSEQLLGMIRLLEGGDVVQVAKAIKRGQRMSLCYQLRKQEEKQTA